MNNIVPTDSFIVDAIATYLGTAEEWSGADACETIANLVGMVRPHPGDVPADEYAEAFRKATDRPIVKTYDQGWRR